MKLKTDLLTHTQGLREGLTVAQGGPDAFVGMLGMLSQESSTKSPMTPKEPHKKALRC